MGLPRAGQWMVSPAFHRYDSDVVGEVLSVNCVTFRVRFSGALGTQTIPLDALPSLARESGTYFADEKPGHEE